MKTMYRTELCDCRTLPAPKSKEWIVSDYQPISKFHRTNGDQLINPDPHPNKRDTLEIRERIMREQ